MIEKLLHFVWIDKPMPTWVKENIHLWSLLNPDFSVFVHNEKCLCDEYRDLYSSLSGVAQKSDLLRISLLKRYGGWYFDTDFIPLRPIKDIVATYPTLEDDNVFVVQQFDAGPKMYANGVLAIGHSDIFNELDAVLLSATKTGVATLSRTALGPDLFTYVIQSRGVCATIGQKEKFFPFPTYHKKEAMLKAKEVLLAKKDLPNPSTEFAFHLWCGGDYPEVL